MPKIMISRKEIGFMNPDTALQNLIKIKEEFADFIKDHGKASEADTRVKVIDRILKEVLGWNEKSFSREDHVESGFVDYTLSINKRNYLVVEAKREGVSFELPTTSHKNLKLSGSILTNKNISDVIKQVRSYCDDSGVRYAVATNGYCWIVFRAIREDIPWKEGNARIFPSIEYILEYFIEFWNLMSFEAISKASLDNEFGNTARFTRELYRVVDQLYNSDLPLERNKLNYQLQPIIAKFFEDIADQDQTEILQKCYVHSKSLNVIAFDLKIVITDEIPKFMKTEDVATIEQTEKNAGQFGHSMQDSVKSDKWKLILILGGIGCGKTTFLKRYQRTVGKQVLDENTIWFHIDFLSSPEESHLELYVYQQILNQMRDYREAYFETLPNVKKAYKNEIESLTHVELKNYAIGSVEYEKKLVEYISEWKKNTIEYVQKLLQTAKPRKELKVVLFLDNVDQLPPDFQSQIFLLAQHITRSVKSITIIAMREESFYTTKVQRTFTAYTNKKFHIASPRFKHLIAHRIDFALEVLNQPNEQIISLEDLDTSSIKDFLTIVKKSIFEYNKQIVRFVEALCFGNMRQALDWFSLFLTSGCTDVEKMLRIYRRDGNYHVAFHEFVKSVMLGDKKYYREEKSQIMNILDCSALKNSSHFTALRIIRLLLKQRGQHTVEGKGYYEIGNLISIFEDIFDNKEDVVNNLNRLVVRQLVEVNTKSIENINGASHVRVTSGGWYFYRYLIKEFSYLDLILQDTPINDIGVANRLERSVQDVDNLIDREDFKIARINVRFDRVQLFIDYLKSEEQKEKDIYMLDKIDTIFKNDFMSEIETFFNRKKEWVLKRLMENREKYSEEFETEEDEEFIEYDEDDVEYDTSYISEEEVESLPKTEE